MPRCIKLLLAVFITVFFAAEAALAGDSASIPVSCSIPAVPGLNAPAIQTNPVESQGNLYGAGQENSEEVDGQEIAPVYEQTNEEQPLIIQEEGEVQLAYNTAGPSMIVQTIYVR